MLAHLAQHARDNPLAPLPAHLSVWRPELPLASPPTRLRRTDPAHPHPQPGRQRMAPGRPLPGLRNQHDPLRHGSRTDQQLPRRTNCRLRHGRCRGRRCGRGKHVVGRRTRVLKPARTDGPHPVRPCPRPDPLIQQITAGKSFHQASKPSAASWAVGSRSAETPTVISSRSQSASDPYRLHRTNPSPSTTETQGSILCLLCLKFQTAEIGLKRLRTPAHGEETVLRQYKSCAATVTTETGGAGARSGTRSRIPGFRTFGIKYTSTAPSPLTCGEGWALIRPPLQQSVTPRSSNSRRTFRNASKRSPPTALWD